MQSNRVSIQVAVYCKLLYIVRMSDKVPTTIYLFIYTNWFYYGNSIIIIIIIITIPIVYIL